MSRVTESVPTCEIDRRTRGLPDAAPAAVNIVLDTWGELARARATRRLPPSVAEEQRAHVRTADGGGLVGEPGSGGRS